jgi:hypothetical protein
MMGSAGPPDAAAGVPEGLAGYLLVGDFACLVLGMRFCAIASSKNVDAFSEGICMRRGLGPGNSSADGCHLRRTFYNSIQRRNTLILLHLHENAKKHEYD